MKLERFIKKLEKLAEKYGGNLEVIMADNAPVVDPIFSLCYPGRENVVITDEEQVILSDDRQNF
ncbi:MAG: hypothetical protein WAP23_01070 [Candidatus Spechtbacterales bacterium]